MVTVWALSGPWALAGAGPSEVKQPLGPPAPPTLALKARRQLPGGAEVVPQLPTALLRQLFDEENPVHKAGTRYMFTTEGHVVSVDRHLREAPWKEFFPEEPGRAAGSLHRPAAPGLRALNSSSNVSCFSGSLCVWTGRRRPN